MRAKNPKILIVFLIIKILLLNGSEGLAVKSKITELIKKAKTQEKYVTLVTNLGEIRIELFWKAAPIACKNFAELARQKYYDNSIFYKVINETLIEGGDPSGTGTGGESFYGHEFEDEVNTSLKHIGAGYVSMENTGPNTNKSRFCITLATLTERDGKNTIFGAVRKGLDIVKKISAVEVDENKKPKETVKIITTKNHKKLKQNLDIKNR